MAIGFKVDFLWYPIGISDFVYSFFSTICCNLENRKWGSRFPHVMKSLYQGELNHNDVDETIVEILTIREELKSFPPQKIVWDIDDLHKLPPWGSNLSKDITDLSNYFITCDGEDLFELMLRVLRESKAEKQNVELTSL